MRKEAEILHQNVEYSFKIKIQELPEYKAKIVYTDGLSSNDQRKTQFDAELAFIELYILMPDYWDEEKEIWPIDWLNSIAAIPTKNNTWLSVGDTIPAGNPPKAIYTNLKATYFILSKPLLLERLFNQNSDNAPNTSPLAIIPIFENEWLYKQSKGTVPLLRKLTKKGNTELVDSYREPVTRKRFLRL